jgi:tetratricopeptide (TPR) repeat protein
MSPSRKKILSILNEHGPGDGMNATDAWQLETDAISKFNAGEYDVALELFFKTTMLAPENPQLHFNLALALAKLGETYPALAVLKKGLEIEDHDKQALRLLSILYAVLKETHQNPREIIGIEWIGQFLTVKDLYLNYLDSTHRIIEDFLDEEAELAHVIAWPSAEQLFIDSKDLGNNKNEIVHELASRPLVACYKYISIPCLVEAEVKSTMKYVVANYVDLLEADRSVALIWLFGKGKNKYDEAEYEDAAGIFEALATVEPTNIAILFYCGKTMRDSGDMDMILRSIDYLKRIIQLNTENALGWYDLSLSYAIIGDFQKELFCLRRAYDLGHSKDDIARITYLESITAPVDPFQP